jgi:hypothetical protein
MESSRISVSKKNSDLAPPDLQINDYSLQGNIKLSKLLLLSMGLSLACSAAIAAEGKPPLFLNRVGETLVKLQLAPAGSEKWGPDQCQFEDDKSVENNEKIPLKEVMPGRYDVRFTDLKGRACTVKNLDVKDGALVVIRENELPPECAKK